MDDYEEWADIPEYVGLYQASSHGRIRSVKRLVKSAIAEGQRIHMVVLTPTYNTSGRQQVALSKKVDGEYYASNKRHLVHRLVYAAFHGPVPEGVEVKHKSDDVCNNREDNLYAQPQPRAITEAQARRIKFGSERQIDLAKEFNVSQTAISHIRTGKTWKHITPSEETQQTTVPGLFD